VARVGARTGARTGTGADEAGPARDKASVAEARRREVARTAGPGADRTGPSGVARLRAAGETPRAS